VKQVETEFEIVCTFAQRSIEIVCAFAQRSIEIVCAFAQRSIEIVCTFAQRSIEIANRVFCSFWSLTKCGHNEMQINERITGYISEIHLYPLANLT
jgi:hypothetical protein